MLQIVIALQTIRHPTSTSTSPRRQALLAAGNKADAQAAFTTSVSVIDRIADKGIVHKNKAARHKSRLSAAVKAIA